MMQKTSVWRWSARRAAALACLLCLPDSALGQLPKASYAGVTWQPPSGMAESQQWETSTCPARCVTYETVGGGRRAGQWPLLMVHEPFVGTIAQFRDRWVADVKTRNADTEVVFREASKQATSGAMLLELSAIELMQGEGRPTGVVLLLIEQGGVVVPLQLYDSSLERAFGAVATLSEVAGSVSIMPAEVIASQRERDADLASLARGIDAGYLQGERAQLFMRVESGVRNEFGLSGMELRAYRDEHLLAFLPGGVFLDEAPASGYRRLDLQDLRRTMQLGRWKAIADGMQATHGDGTVRTYRQVGGAAGARQLSFDGETWTEVPSYDPAELVGRYRSVETSTFGGLQTGMPTMIASRAEADLDLQADGQFQMSRDSYTAVSGANLAGGTGGRTRISGRWQYDAASYTITLTPHDGTPAIAGPFHGGPGTTPAQVKPGASLDWRVLQGERWWLAK